MRIILICLLALLNSGCDYQSMMQKFIPKEENRLALTYLEQLSKGDYREINKHLDPSTQGTDTAQIFAHMTALFPREAPREVNTVGASTNIINGVRTVQLTYQYKYTHSYLLASISFKKVKNSTTITGININPLSKPLEEINKFTFKGKGITHYIVFALTVAMPVLTIIALYLCAKTPIPKMKWLWMLFIALGVTQITINWTTGHIVFSPIAVQLLSASFFKAGPYGPLSLSFSIPVGIIVFMLKRKMWLAEKA